MKRYIDADKLIAEIERRIQNLRGIAVDNPMLAQTMRLSFEDILSFIGSLQQEAEEERRKINDEMKKNAIEYRDSVIKHIEEKRVLPSFRGQLLHDFKNELNTMKQILNIQMWPQTQYAILEKVALVFASWGGYHFHPKESLSKDELEQEQPEQIEEYGPYARQYPKSKVSQEQPEVDLEKAARNVYESWMGGTMNDVRRDMVELDKVLNARKEDSK